MRKIESIMVKTISQNNDSENNMSVSSQRAGTGGGRGVQSIQSIM